MIPRLRRATIDEHDCDPGQDELTSYGYSFQDLKT